MIEVFATNITNREEAKQISEQLNHRYPTFCIHFDLEDCDHVLRINSFQQPLEKSSIIKLVAQNGYAIEVLSDEVLLLQA